MKLYSIVRRNRKSGKVKTVYVGTAPDVKTTSSKNQAQENCSRLNRTFAIKFEYVLVEFEGD